MNLSDVLAEARKNQMAMSSSQRSCYSTKVKPAKRLPKNQVNQKAIQAFLTRQNEDENRKRIEAAKKKEELLKLRDASKTTKKANSMAKRTKDNLKVYKGEDVLGLYPEPKKRRTDGSSADLTPEQHKRHKAFMKNITKLKVPGVNDDESDGAHEPLPQRDERKMKKLEKRKAKARSAANLDFTDLIKMAEEQKKVNECSSSSEESDSGDDSDGSTDRYGKPLSAEEKYHRERRKRLELEERLKMTQKKQIPESHSKKSSKPLTNFKIGKLNPGMSDDAKRAKVKALMKNFNKSSQNIPNGKTKSANNFKPPKSKEVPQSSISKSSKNISDPQKEKRKRKSSELADSSSYKSVKKPKMLPPASMGEAIAAYLKEQDMKSSSVRKSFPPMQKFQDTKSNRLKTEAACLKKSTSIPVKSKPKKPVANPYKHTVVKDKGVDRSKQWIEPWAKEKAKKVHDEPPPRKGKCTLSVTSESVRTNYPGVAREDPYIQAYKKTGRVIKNFTPETINKYKAHMIRKFREEGRPIPKALLSHQQPPQKRRYGVLGDDSEDEYDSELEDFIADDEEQLDGEIDYSLHIKQIFGYDKSKYKRESEWELSKMDASYKDIEKEEKRSLRIAKEEDAREAKLEEERMKRKTSKKR